jgi:hypothetical protein
MRYNKRLPCRDDDGQERFEAQGLKKRRLKKQKSPQRSLFCGGAQREKDTPVLVYRH